MAPRGCHGAPPGPLQAPPQHLLLTQPSCISTPSLGLFQPRRQDPFWDLLALPGGPTWGALKQHQASPPAHVPQLWCRKNASFLSPNSRCLSSSQYISLHPADLRFLRHETCTCPLVPILWASVSGSLSRPSVLEGREMTALFSPPFCLRYTPEGIHRGLHRHGSLQTSACTLSSKSFLPPPSDAMSLP